MAAAKKLARSDVGEYEEGALPGHKTGGGLPHPYPYEDGEATYRAPKHWRMPAVPKEGMDLLGKIRKLPTSDRMVVYEPVLGENKTAGGIIVPEVAGDDSSNKDHQCWILAVGPDAFAQGYRVGDCIIMSQYAGVQLKRREAAKKRSPLGVIRTEDVICKDYEEA